MHEEIIKELTKKLIKLALEEDLSPNGDISVDFLKNKAIQKKAQIIAKEDGVIACAYLVEAVLEEYAVIASKAKQSPNKYKIITKIQDGKEFKQGDVLIELEAPAHYLLSCERTILNLLQRTCAIAKATKDLSSIIKDYPCKLLDTRKTMPGMRAIEKEAFKTGGGENHRFNLSDAVMLKENHLEVLGLDLLETIKSIKSDKKIIVEINKDNLDKLEAVISSGVDQIMLDNFSPEEVTKHVKQIRALSPEPSAPSIEVSGNITKDNIEAYARTGCDYISTSACMTRVHNLDLSMKLS